MTAVAILPGCPHPVAPTPGSVAAGTVVGATPDWDALVRAVPDLAALDHTPQDARWHAEGDVGTHTRLVLARLAELPQWAALDAQAREILWAAAALHDLGKATTTRTEDARITAPGHSRAGALLARRRLWERGVPFELREHVVALVRWHMRPAHLFTQPDPVRDVARMSMTARLDHLALLATADTLGRSGPDPRDALTTLELFAEFAAEQGCLTAPFPFASDHSRVAYFRTPGRDPHYAAHDDTWGTVTVMAGLPGSGKDHWIARHRPDAPVVSLDAIRRARGLAAGEASLAVQQAYDEATEHLRARRPFTWNSTNLVRDLRAGVLGTCLRYGARVEVVYVEVPHAVQRAQNESRPHDQVVPPEVMDTRMLAKWDIPDHTEAHRIEQVVRDVPLSRRGAPAPTQVRRDR